jgi:hypothetical protein
MNPDSRAVVIMKIRQAAWSAPLLSLFVLLTSSPLSADEGDKPWWPWLLVGTGGAMTVAGGVTWGMGEADYGRVDDAITKADPDNHDIIPMTQDRAWDLQQSGDTKTLLGPVLVGVGAAVAATGTALLLYMGPSAETDVYPARRGPLLVPIAYEDGGGAAVSFTF